MYLLLLISFMQWKWC